MDNTKPTRFRRSRRAWQTILARDEHVVLPHAQLASKLGCSLTTVKRWRRAIEAPPASPPLGDAAGAPHFLRVEASAVPAPHPDPSIAVHVEAGPAARAVFSSMPAPEYLAALLRSLGSAPC